MGAAGWRPQHDEVRRARDLGDPLAHHPPQLLERRQPVGRELGDGVHGLAARHAHLHRPEVVEIARHGGLRRRDPFARRADRRAGAGWSPRAAPISRAIVCWRWTLLITVATPSRNASAPRAAWRRLWPCWNTALCGPSITSAVTSSPRYAGRQCMKIAPGAAFDIAVSSTVKRLERGHPILLVGLLPHRHPGVGVHRVGSVDRLRDTPELRHGRGAEQRQPLELGVVGVVAGRAREAQVHRRATRTPRRASGPRCCSRRPTRRCARRGRRAAAAWSGRRPVPAAGGSGRTAC